MNSYIASPFFSLIISIILLMGCFELGKISIRKSSLRNYIESVSSVEFQYCSVGTVIILIIIFPLIAFINYASKMF